MKLNMYSWIYQWKGIHEHSGSAAYLKKCVDKIKIVSNLFSIWFAHTENLINSIHSLLFLIFG